MTTWLGTAPHTCDSCGAPILSIFIDGATKYGPWAIMCPTCHTLGPGINKLGPGVGQKFEKQKDGSWLKIAG